MYNIIYLHVHAKKKGGHSKQGNCIHPEGKERHKQTVELNYIIQLLLVLINYVII